MAEPGRLLGVLALGALLVPTSTPDRDDDLVTDGLAELPAIAAGATPMIVVADLDAASDANGLERPTDPDDPDVIRWLAALTGVSLDVGGAPPPVFVPLPESLISREVGEIADEVGWSILDVSTVAAVDAPPDHFTVMRGDIGDDTLSSALPEVVDGVVSSGEGDDFAPGPTPTPLSRLGVPQRMAVDEDRIAVSPSTPMVAAWLAGDDTTIANDPALGAVASALDDARVASALLVPAGPRTVIDALGPRATPAAIEQLTEDLTGIALTVPFDAVGTGWGVDDDGAAEITLVYHLADAAAAATAAPQVERVFTDGRSIVDRRPLSDLLVVEDVEVSEQLVIATLSLGPDGRPQVIMDMLVRGELPFLHLP